MKRRGSVLVCVCALVAAEAAARTKPTNYPPEFAARVAGRVKRPLGDLFGLRNFGVNLTRLASGAQSALHHRHSKQDELVYVLEGEIMLQVGDKRILATAGMFANMPVGTPHSFKN